MNYIMAKIMKWNWTPSLFHYVQTELYYVSLFHTFKTKSRNCASLSFRWSYCFTSKSMPSLNPVALLLEALFMTLNATFYVNGIVQPMGQWWRCKQNKIVNENVFRNFFTKTNMFIKHDMLFYKKNFAKTHMFFKVEKA